MSKARAVRPELLTLLVSLAFLLFYNLPLWQRLLAITPGGWQGLGMMLAVGLMIAAIFNLALTLLAFRWLLKPALTLLILAAAGTTYFMTQYGVLMDVGMLRNVMQTNPAEVATCFRRSSPSTWCCLVRCRSGCCGAPRCATGRGHASC